METVNQRKNQAHANNSKFNISQNDYMSPGDSWRVADAIISVENSF